MKQGDYSYEQFLDKKFTLSVQKYTVVNQALMHLTGKRHNTAPSTSHVLQSAESAESAFEYNTHYLLCGTKDLYHGKN